MAKAAKSTKKNALWAVVGISYPKTAKEYNRLKRLGGIRNNQKLTPEKRHEEYGKLKDVAAGGRCDDVPKQVRAIWLEQGVITDVNPKGGAK
jgi:hypothetical protein